MPAREEVTELVALVDRLEGLLERSALSELEVEVGGTTVVLRTPAAITPPVTPAPPPAGPAPAFGADEAGAEEAGGESAGLETGPAASTAHAVTAPLTGVYYRSPSPGAEPYVREGGQVNAGQVIGLIEAMKLFNEIKSDVTGVVRKIGPHDGELVKARQTLIEVDPT